jgi:hypothetical protein
MRFTKMIKKLVLITTILSLLFSVSAYATTHPAVAEDDAGNPAWDNIAIYYIAGDSLQAFNNCGYDIVVTFKDNVDATLGTPFTVIASENSTEPIEAGTHKVCVKKDGGAEEDCISCRLGRGVPSLTPYGIGILILLLVASATWVLYRKRAKATA